LTPTLSDSVLERAALRVSALLGLHFPETRRRELRQGLLRATEELGAGDDTTLEWLAKPELSRRELDVLASHLTVGETYFFREKAVFRALETEILPALIDERQKTSRALRIWSAGCCTGEEPYSLAMLLEQLIPDLDCWDISILGTDVNPRFLRRATEGLYNTWSFRDVDARIQQRFFTPRAPGRYEISPDVKRRVRFQHLNLVEDAFPSPLNGTWELDLVLCRNVLMYFAGTTASEVIARVRRCLLPGGWLVVSPSETAQALFQGFSQVHCQDAILYRRDAEPRPVTHTPAIDGNEEVQTGSSSVRRRRSSRSSVRVPARTDRPVRTERPNAGMSLAALARSAADRGQLDSALECCERALATHKLDPAIHHLHATILDELGRPHDAARALGRALYVDPDFVLAHFALGRLAQKLCQFRKARKHFDNVLFLLRRAAPESELPESEGLTAGHLAELTRGLLSKLT
jgi:chemotaxis protein methyltransferase CheR